MSASSRKRRKSLPARVQWDRPATAIAQTAQPVTSTREKIATLLSHAVDVRSKLTAINYSLDGQGADKPGNATPPAPNSVDFLLMEFANVIADIDDSVSRIGAHI